MSRLSSPRRAGDDAPGVARDPVPPGLARPARVAAALDFRRAHTVAAYQAASARSNARLTYPHIGQRTTA